MTTSSSTFWVTLRHRDTRLPIQWANEHDLDRNEAYKFWFPELPTGKFIPAISKDIVAVKGPYLVRSAKVDGRTLQLTGDLNATETVEVIAPSSIKNVKWNGHSVRVQRSKSGSLKGELCFNKPRLELPNLTTLDWVCNRDLHRLKQQKTGL